MLAVQLTACNTCVERFAVVLVLSSWGCCDLTLKTGGQMFPAVAWFPVSGCLPLRHTQSPAHIMTDLLLCRFKEAK